jgi:hypothetical protein
MSPAVMVLMDSFFAIASGKAFFVSFCLYQTVYRNRLGKSTKKNCKNASFPELFAKIAGRLMISIEADDFLYYDC